ncbi:hypothetical protein ARC78_01625 [Stenotrophomonas pictorum JCM 9942]|uniref:Diguanylate cyclase n=1 Tax=Stenotrophomonas pictorum JCM 9942 TaxID=1236960 RepID=A0A0R0AD58_9GAMM|nr:GGDEF domain-containing phosphodiesterase [Stenotrophomonas pictorum]KRG39444.1 hypothetical protein ARC78_01625 [Stenotrophomonas pictorum JCM 9942]
MLVGSYNPLFVVLSVLVAILASYTALDMAARVSVADSRRSAALWLLAGSGAMGAGIWSMHFIGMLAFRLPIPVGYDLWLTLQSLLVAIASALFALWLVSRPTLPHLRLALGALLMGIGIACMHYLGMTALRMHPQIEYDRFWFALSIVIAVAASWSALFIAFRLRASDHPLPARLAAAIVLGLAIVGMHYTGMAAAHFAEGSVCAAAGTGGLPTEWLAAFVVVVSVAVIGVTLLVSLLEQRTRSRLLHLRNSMLAASLDDARKELFHANLHDPLTGLPNRQRALERIDQQIASARDAGHSLAVLSLDLDELRQINGAFGHHVGDTVLVGVSERLRQLMCAGDLVARLGGDQFVIATPIEDEPAARRLAERVITAINTLRVGGRDMRVTCSIGVALLSADTEAGQSLVSLSEIAMRHAQQAGRNIHAVYAEWMKGSVEQDIRLLADLRSAIGTPQLLLHYQPRIHANSGRVGGAEALLRWRHPEHGLIPCERVIRLAEQHDLMEPLGQWVLNEACRQMRSWQDAGHQDWRISVNLSSRQLGSGQLLGQVRQILEHNGLHPSRLILEISESVVMHDADTTSTSLRALAALGIGISIDDFGTGYSSLLQLKRLPATELKIDRAFILAVEESDEDVVIISAIIALGHALNMDVVAEGIETQGQRTYIERLGCDYLQGNQLGQPVSAESFMRLHGGVALPAVDHSEP